MSALRKVRCTYRGGGSLTKFYPVGITCTARSGDQIPALSSVFGSMSRLGRYFNISNRSGVQIILAQD